jgi:hypothetical protein
MRRDAFELACRLAREAEAVCPHSLSNRKREGRGWLLGDVHNRPGHCSFVRRHNSSKGPAGKWTEQGARRMSLRVWAWVLSHRRLTALAQPTASEVREVA